MLPRFENLQVATTDLYTTFYLFINLIVVVEVEELSDVGESTDCTAVQSCDLPQEPSPA